MHSIVSLLSPITRRCCTPLQYDSASRKPKAVNYDWLLVRVPRSSLLVKRTVLKYCNRQPIDEIPGLPLLAPSKYPSYSMSGETKKGVDWKAGVGKTLCFRKSSLTIFSLFSLSLTLMYLDYSGIAFSVKAGVLTFSMCDLRICILFWLRVRWYSSILMLKSCCA